jgi:hypothetical protein
LLALKYEMMQCGTLLDQSLRRPAAAAPLQQQKIHKNPFLLPLHLLLPIVSIN